MGLRTDREVFVKVSHRIESPCPLSPQCYSFIQKRPTHRSTPWRLEETTRTAAPLRVVEAKEGDIFPIVQGGAKKSYNREVPPCPWPSFVCPLFLELGVTATLFTEGAGSPLVSALLRLSSFKGTTHSMRK